MSRRIYKVIVGWVIMIWLLTACSSQTRYHQFRHINERGWKLTDTVSLEVPLTDSLHSHLLTLQLRHTTRYPYRNLQMGVQVISPDSQFTKTRQFSAILIDEHGDWLGSGQSGLYNFDIGEMLLAPSSPGNWHIRIFQSMDDISLPGIHDVGIEISALPAGINAQEYK